MKFRLAAIALVLQFQIIPAFSQDLIIKLKPEFNNYLKNNPIENKRLKALFDAFGVASVRSTLHKKQAKPTYLDNTYFVYLNSTQYKEDILKALQQSGYFEYVEVKSSNDITALHLPNDPFAQPSTGTQYYLDKINAYKAWDISKGDTNVVICVVDNGADFNHPELKNKIKKNQNDPIDGIDNDNDGYTDNYMGWDMANNDNFPEDSTGAYAHGTEVSTLAAGATNNNLGIASVGYNCKFIPIKIFNNSANSGASGYEAVIYAAEHGCKVINMSWGMVGGFNNYGQAVMNYAAIDHDAVLVGATYPQDGTNVFTTPADYENVISVSALQSNDQKAIPQATHYWIDLSAPSIDVYTADFGGGYRYNSGVSLGVPLVSGAAALARSVYPWMNSTQISELLRVTATNIDTVATNKNYAEKLGHGRLDVYNALTNTKTPAVRILEYELRQTTGDTVSLQLGFKNYLYPTKNVRFDFRQFNGGFEVLDSTTSAGIVNMLDSSATALASIKIRILPFTSTNSSEIVRIGISDSANHYSDYQYFYLNKNGVIPNVITETKTKTISEDKTKIYPNPFNELILIEIENSEEVTISDMTGKKMVSYTNPSEILSINTKEWQSGVYSAQIRTQNGSYCYKILKK